MNTDTITVIVIADNSNGEPEMLAYDVNATLQEVDNGDHYDKAKEMAVCNGYEPKAAFDLKDYAGQQLIGACPLYGSKVRQISELQAQ